MKRQSVKNNKGGGDNSFSFEPVLAERDYKGNPTGRMREKFQTDNVDDLTKGCLDFFLSLCYLKI